MISSQPALGALAARAANEPRVALDTEADSLHSYFEKLCLVQVSTLSSHELVDPLAGLDLKPLFAALEPIRVVLHGADYDLRLLNRSASFAPARLFDTMVAARLCGLKELGLAALVEKYFGIRLSKASQKANWAIRPLPPQMIEYALNDTRYLLEISDILENDLRRLGRWPWFEESCARVVASARETRGRDESRAWRISGSATLPPRAKSVLRNLWQWRDSEARAWDRPPFHVMGNEAMLRIARQAADGDAVQIPRMGQRRRKSFEVVLARALDVPEQDWPQPEKPQRRRPTREQAGRLEALRKVRDRVAKEHGIEPAILAPRQALEATADDPGCDALMGWQRQLLGLPHASQPRPPVPTLP